MALASGFFLTLKSYHAAYANGELVHEPSSAQAWGRHAGSRVYEFDVRSTWHTILDQYFSTSAGYMVRDEAPNEFGFPDIILFEHRRVSGTRQ